MQIWKFFEGEKSCHYSNLQFCYVQTAITCPAVNTPNDGQTPSCTDDNNYNSVCTFACNDGFALVGSPTLTCGGDGSSTTGSYDNPEPTCQGR